MTTDYYAEYLAERLSNAIHEEELNTILNMLFNAIKTETYIDPLGLMEYLKAQYPNRWKKKMEEIYAQGDESNTDTR